VKNGVVVAVICNTDYIYQGEVTRTAKYDYTLTLGQGVTGPADIYTPWYQHSASSYTLTASAGEHGAISPSGAIAVAAGRSQGFSITPDPCYVVERVAIDGVDIDKVTEYTFTNVRGDHSIAVTFAPPSFRIWTVRVGAGSIDPSGEVWVSPGMDQTFTVVPNRGSVICGVTVDGTPVGAVANYTFTDVNSDHILRVEFCTTSR
jgi:type IV pilus assembly protein PilY1